MAGNNVGVLDLLKKYPSCKPSLLSLLENLPPLPPRYYSASSSPLKNPSQIHIAFNVIEYTDKAGIQKQGLCTTWLEKKCMPLLKETTTATTSDEKNQPEAATIPIFKKPSGDFKLPEDSSTPIVMIGPGTGAAPFRGFLQHRQLLLQQK